MSGNMSETLDGRTAADLMLVAPKTLPGDVTVAAAREVLDDPHVQMLLLADGAAFRGAITQIPEDAGPGDDAVLYADPDTEAIGPDEPAELAFARTKLNPHRRVVVLDDDRNLLGLLCLDKSRTHFCRNRV
jgi:hypothetical protein